MPVVFGVYWVAFGIGWWRLGGGKMLKNA